MQSCPILRNTNLDVLLFFIQTLHNRAEIDTWKQRNTTSKNYILKTNEPDQKRHLYGIAMAREMWQKIETQCDLNAKDIENSCLQRIYAYKYDSDEFHNFNTLLADSNKLREIGRPMLDHHIINRLLVALPESFVRAQSNWQLIPEAERTVVRLVNNLKSEEQIIKLHSKPKEVVLVAKQSQNPEPPSSSHDGRNFHTISFSNGRRSTAS